MLVVPPKPCDEFTPKRNLSRTKYRPQKEIKKMNFEEVKSKFDIKEIAEWIVDSELQEIGSGTFEFEKGVCPLCGHEGCF
jgi:rRNA maturation endonuclease Nob1